jgi:hypothetical protein
LRSKRAQITVIPGGQDILEKAWGGAFSVPSHAEAVAIGNPFGMFRRKTLMDDGVFLMENEIF